MSRHFLVPTAELFRHPGVQRRVTVTGRLPDMAVSSARLADDEIRVDLTLEAQGSALTASGRVTGRWTGECRRCLGPTGGEVTVDLREIFEPDPVEGETYPLGADHVDLAPALRDALALALPLAPLCDEACVGPDPEAHPVAVEGEADAAGGANGTGGANGHDRDAPVDPRWSALDSLRFDQ